MCLYPKLIKNRKYTANKKNGGNVPILYDKRAEYVPVGCGKCIECLKQKSRSWNIRLQEEIKSDNTGIFVTLTFNTPSLIKYVNQIPLSGYDRDNEICTQAVRHFLERWRKKYKKSLKHWLVTELGHKNTEHVHIHGIVFTNEINDIETIWQNGYVFTGTYVNAKTINYITKYVTKTDPDHKYYKPKILTSPGIGNKYFNRKDYTLNIFKPTGTNELYINQQGYKMNMPIYYRNKIYTDEQREILWLQRLDKEERYVCGEKINVSQNDNDYYKLLEYHRIINKQLGYGDDSKDWDKIRYENQKRNLKLKERLNHY